MSPPAGHRYPAQRALRFFPVDSSAEAPAGLAIDARGGLRTVEGADAVRQSLMTLLSTRPGERVMRPDYGCPLDRLAFAPMVPTTYTLADLMVRRAIERFEPRAAIHRLIVGSDPLVPARLIISLEFSAQGEPAGEWLDFSLETLPDEPAS